MNSAVKTAKIEHLHPFLLFVLYAQATRSIARPAVPLTLSQMAPMAASPLPLPSNAVPVADLSQAPMPMHAPSLSSTDTSYSSSTDSYDEALIDEGADILHYFLSGMEDLCAPVLPPVHDEGLPTASDGGRYARIERFTKRASRSPKKLMGATTAAKKLMGATTAAQGTLLSQPPF